MAWSIKVPNVGMLSQWIRWRAPPVSSFQETRQSEEEPPHSLFWECDRVILNSSSRSLGADTPHIANLYWLDIVHSAQPEDHGTTRGNGSMKNHKSYFMPSWARGSTLDA